MLRWNRRKFQTAFTVAKPVSCELDKIALLGTLPEKKRSRPTWPDGIARQLPGPEEARLEHCTMVAKRPVDLWNMTRREPSVPLASASGLSGGLRIAWFVESQGSFRQNEEGDCLGGPLAPTAARRRRHALPRLGCLLLAVKKLWRRERGMAMSLRMVLEGVADGWMGRSLAEEVSETVSSDRILEGWEG